MLYCFPYLQNKPVLRAYLKRLRLYKFVFYRNGGDINR